MRVIVIERKENKAYSLLIH